jgi:hypothetical protein
MDLHRLFGSNARRIGDALKSIWPLRSPKSRKNNPGTPILVPSKILWGGMWHNPRLLQKNKMMSVVYVSRWRREWDSNPRYSFPHTRFPSVRLKPLGHLSRCLLLKGQDDFCKRARPRGQRFPQPIEGTSEFTSPQARAAAMAMAGRKPETVQCSRAPELADRSHNVCGSAPVGPAAATLPRYSSCSV